MMLEERWKRLCGKRNLDGSVQWRVMESAYSSADRAYHNLHHIEDCLDRFDEFCDLAIDPWSVEQAIWFHDLVYDTRAADNEERSADAARDFLGEASEGETVADLIRATKHECCPVGEDACFICDLDLSILGRDLDTYRNYMEAIRREYSWVPEEDYVLGRTRVLRSFLDREFLYRLGPFRERYEVQARANLGWEIDRLSGAAD